MKLKNVLLPVMASLMLGNVVVAQDVDEVKKLLRYEKYQSAKALIGNGNLTPELAYYLGLAELYSDNVEAAKMAFTKAGDNVYGKTGLAIIEFKTGNVTAANATVDELVSKTKKKEVLPLVLAADAIRISENADYLKAKSIYKQALDKQQDPYTYISLGDVNRNIPNGGGEAMTAYENAIRIDPTNSLAYSKIGNLWYAARRYDLALENYNKAMEVDPSNPIPYRELAYAYYFVQKFELSKQNIEKYLALSDKTVEDQIQYVGILYRAKDYQNAISIAQKLINEGQTKAGLYGVLAYSQIETGDTANALSNVEKYFQTQDSKRIGVDDYLSYGKILLLNNQQAKAEEQFLKAVNLDEQNKGETYRKIAELYRSTKSPDHYKLVGDYYGKAVETDANVTPTDYFYWGLYNYYARDYETADKVFATFESKYPDQPSAPYWRGRTAAAMDPQAKNGNAVEPYLKWLAFDTSTPKNNTDLMQAYQWLALYYYNKGNKAEKDNYIQKILEIEPNNEFAKQLKKQ